MNQDYLMHYGVKGMKWRVHRTAQAISTYSKTGRTDEIEKEKSTAEGWKRINAPKKAKEAKLKTYDIALNVITKGKHKAVARGRNMVLKILGNLSPNSLHKIASKAKTRNK